MDGMIPHETALSPYPSETYGDPHGAAWDLLGRGGTQWEYRRLANYGSEGWGFKSSRAHHPKSNPHNRLEEIEFRLYVGRRVYRCSIVARKHGLGRGRGGVCS